MAFNVYVPPIADGLLGGLLALLVQDARRGGLLASLVQDARPVFDDGYGKIVYVFGTPRPVRALTLGLYRFDAEDGLENEGLRL